MTDETKIPNNHVVGVIHGEQAAESATDELARIGFDSARVLRGWEANDRIDARGEESNPVAGLIKQVAGHLSEQVSYLEQYEEQAQQGGKIVAVKVDDGDQAHEVGEVLQRYGAVNVRFFGKLAVSDLTPASNPSAPSDERP